MTGLGSELAPFALLGILGAVHCAGMCGGFAIAVAGTGERGRSAFLQRQLGYVIGKALTYAILGTALAAGSHAVAHAGADWSGAPDSGAALTWTRKLSAGLAGLTMIWFGLSLTGLPLPTWRPTTGLAASFLGGLRTLFSSALSLPGSTGALATGLVTGFLPCGLSWSAFALAAGKPPAVAFAGLLVFGLSTAPALLLSAWGWRGLKQHHRVLAARLAGPLLLVFGLFTLTRAGIFREQVDVLPDCCSEAESEEPG